MLNLEHIRELLEYDGTSGSLTWKPRGARWFTTTAARSAEHSCKIWNRRFAGKPALCGIDTHGYKYGTLLGKRAYAHRVAACFIIGGWPTGDIDHVNGDRTDNRSANLRSVSRRQNAKNKSILNNNKSGAHGVSWNAQNRNWRARIVTESGTKEIGSFRNKIDAINARKRAERDFGYHPNHGRIQHPSTAVPCTLK